MSLQQDLIKILQQGQARKTVDDVIAWTGTSTARFKILIETITGNPDQKMRDRAAWAMSYIAVEQPELVDEHWDTFVKLLLDPKTSHPVKRNLVRFMQELDIPKRFQGKVTNRCFELINDPNEDIAIRAFAMGILANMLPQYPEMANELRISIEDLLPYASSGLKNRANKVLLLIDKIR